MNMLHDLAQVGPAIAFIGVAIWWAATISRNVKSLEVDVLGLKSDMSGLKTDVAEIKAAVLK